VVDAEDVLVVVGYHCLAYIASVYPLPTDDERNLDLPGRKVTEGVLQLGPLGSTRCIIKHRFILGNRYLENRIGHDYASYSVSAAKRTPMEASSWWLEAQTALKGIVLAEKLCQSFRGDAFH
jgi:hypothetical protein